MNNFPSHSWQQRQHSASATSRRDSSAPLPFDPNEEEAVVGGGVVSQDASLGQGGAFNNNNNNNNNNNTEAPPEQQQQQRPLTAYNIFFREQRLRIVQFQQQNPGTKIPSQIGPLIQQGWKQLLPSQRHHYEGLATASRQLLQQQQQMQVQNGSTRTNGMSAHQRLPSAIVAATAMGTGLRPPRPTTTTSTTTINVTANNNNNNHVGGDDDEPPISKAAIAALAQKLDPQMIDFLIRTFA